VSVHWLLERMEEWGDRPAVVRGDETLSYACLLDAVAVWERRLDASDIGAGDVVGLVGDHSP
jgi:non-ribosomal peptide synthetase component E (peptide arylation enzyme)